MAIEKKEKKALSVLFQLLQFLMPYKKRVGIFLMALLFTSGITLAMGQGVRMLIDKGFVDQSMAQLNTAIVFILMLSVLMAAGTFVRFYLISWLGERVSADIRLAVFNRLVGLHPSFFESNRSGEIISRLTTDTTLLQSIIGSSFSIALRSFISFFGGLIMLAVTNGKLTLIIVAGVPLVLMPVLIFGRRVRSLSRKSQDSIADVGSYAGEIVQNIKTVQSFTRESWERRAFGIEVESAFSIARSRVKQRGFLMAGVILLVFGSLTGMLWVGGSDVLSGKMSGGDLGAFIFYAVLVAAAVGSLSEVFGELQRAAGATERLMELLHQKSDIQEIENAIDPNQLNASLRLKNVSFAYPSRPEHRALNDFNLTISAGKVLALVGPSGAGKTTVFELLQRFYDPQQGQVLMGDELSHPIDELDLLKLRQQIAVVSQQPSLFSADVMYNIRYGRLDATDDEVIAAAKAAHAHQFIQQLPQGYASELGEQGVRLSGGQRQRIAIARAILKNPKILLLDEATSALDAESEFHVQQALEEVMKDRTTVIIAHRLSTILHADSIAVMDHGSVVGQGSHDELIKRSDLYQRLYTLQFESNTAKSVESD
ncbi:MAG: ATP-binding cassette domain-containing protein [Pseudomonadales bacterium]|nr:ATP-binding cassette domain-containing protein [Pseudomonadales bacterium]